MAKENIDREVTIIQKAIRAGEFKRKIPSLDEIENFLHDELDYIVMNQYEIDNKVITHEDVKNIRNALL